MEFNMSLVNKVFEIIEDDEELLEQFPEMKVGTVFKVITVDKENGHEDGITSVKIKNGPYLHINARDSWFWCFYCEDGMYQLKEIEEYDSDLFPAVTLGFFDDGQPITDHLEAAKIRVNGYEANIMQAAADYIRALEKQLSFSS